MQLVHPKWILFDAADTLFRPEPDVALVYQDIASEHGLKRSVETIRDRFLPAFQKHFADDLAGEKLDRERWLRVVFEVLDTTTTAIFDKLWDHFAKPSSWHLFDDVDPVWNWLVENGFQIAIASNFDRRLLKIVSAMPPLDRASHVFFSSGVGFSKPSRQFFCAIEQQLEAIPHELMMIGDNKRADFVGAKNAGWQALHLDREDTSAELPTIATLTALKAILH